MVFIYVIKNVKFLLKLSCDNTFESDYILVWREIFDIIY